VIYNHCKRDYLSLEDVTTDVTTRRHTFEESLILDFKLMDK